MLKMISSEATIPVPKTPEWATRVRRYDKNLKFQLKHHAKRSVSEHIYEPGSDQFIRSNSVHLTKELEVFKLIDGQYVKVFDGKSEMADMYRAGAYTKEQIMARIFEE